MSIAVLAARRDAGGGLLLVALDVDPELARAYTAPGQYVEVTTPAARGYFVLGSNIGQSPFELLVKNAGDAADALFSMPFGSAIEIKGPLGTGFPVANAETRAVVVAVVGSALAVARPVMHLRIAEGTARSTFLFLGLRAPADLPIAEEVAAWSDAGVNVVLCLSRSELEHDMAVLPHARRAVGYVQLAVARAVESGIVPGGALVVAAGPGAMLQEMRAFAASHAATHHSAHPPLEVVTNV